MEHSIIEHTTKNVVPSTEGRYDESDDEHEEHTASIVVDAHLKKHKEKEDEHFAKMNALLEVARSTYPMAEEGTQNIRNKEEGGIESRHSHTLAKLKEHQQGDKRDDCRRYLLGSHESRNPQEWVMLMSYHFVCIFELG